MARQPKNRTKTRSLIIADDLGDQYQHLDPAYPHFDDVLARAQNDPRLMATIETISTAVWAARSKTSFTR